VQAIRQCGRAFGMIGVRVSDQHECNNAAADSVGNGVQVVIEARAWINDRNARASDQICPSVIGEGFAATMVLTSQ
jgi:hypothetical protein